MARAKKSQWSELNAYRRNKRRENPKGVVAERVRAAVKLCERFGYPVGDPEPETYNAAMNAAVKAMRCRLGVEE